MCAKKRVPKSLPPGRITMSLFAAAVFISTVGLTTRSFGRAAAPSRYTHTTDGFWTGWTPGADPPYEWYDISFTRGMFSYFAADYIVSSPTSTTGRLYVMNDFIGNQTGIGPGQFNSFTVSMPNKLVTDTYQIRVYSDRVEAWVNGVRTTSVNGAYQYSTSPYFPDANHTVYEIDLSVTQQMSVAMAATDPKSGPSAGGNNGGAFVGTITPVAGGGVTIQQIIVPICFSVDGGRYNALRDGIVGPPPNPAEGVHTSYRFPNDVFTLGSAGGHNFATEGEIFQSAANFDDVPDSNNANRISGALGVRIGPHNPPPAAPPGPFVPGAMGLVPNDNINAMSFGKDGGNVLHFSVDPASVGRFMTGVRFQAVTSPTPGLLPGVLPANSAGGDPGDEAAGDIFVSSSFWMLPVFGAYLRPMPAVAIMGRNALELDEGSLGLQAAALTGSFIGAPEDDLDALEMSDANDEIWGVDLDEDGFVDGDPNRNVFFSLDPWSPSVVLSLGAVMPSDILITRDATRSFATFADGPVDIGLAPADDLDALVVSDMPNYFGMGHLGQLDPNVDEALFSLAPNSPTLLGPDGLPGTIDDFSAADVFYTDFDGTFWLYASAGFLGLAATDNLNALDISLTMRDYCTWAGLNAFAHEWLEDCDQENDWCNQYDMDFSGSVANEDYALLAGLWPPAMPPEPNEPNDPPPVWYSCWDIPRQCHGDADGEQHRMGYSVYTRDLAIFTAAYDTNDGDFLYNPCADYDRDYDVDRYDQIVLETWWKVLDVPADCPGRPD